MSYLFIRNKVNLPGLNVDKPTAFLIGSINKVTSALEQKSLELNVAGIVVGLEVNSGERHALLVYPNPVSIGSTSLFTWRLGHSKFFDR